MEKEDISLGRLFIGINAMRPEGKLFAIQKRTGQDYIPNEVLEVQDGWLFWVRDNKGERITWGCFKMISIRPR